VEGVVHHDVVLDAAVEAFAQLEAAAEAQVVDDFVVGGAVVEVDVPAVVASPAVVAERGFPDSVE
jgi:hypothetical protein